MKKVLVIGAGKSTIISSLLLTQAAISAQGKEPERGILITDKPMNLNAEVPKPMVTGDKPSTPNGHKQRPTKNRKHVQLGSYKFKSKTKK